MNLPIIDSCDGCGACCMEEPTPPGYAAVILNPDSWPDWTGDHARVEQLPDEAIRLLLDALPEDGQNKPCCWLDQQTRQCRFYDLRPQICRGFERSTPECHAWRQEYLCDTPATGPTG